MDWFLYDRELRHERVKKYSVLQLDNVDLSLFPDMPFSSTLGWLRKTVQYLIDFSFE